MTDLKELARLAVEEQDENTKHLYDIFEQIRQAILNHEERIKILEKR